MIVLYGHRKECYYCTFFFLTYIESDFSFIGRSIKKIQFIQKLPKLTNKWIV